MTTNSRKSRSMRIAGIASIPVALIAAGAIVGGASYSAFNATTSTPTSNWAAGTVALTNDSEASALFTATDIAPGATGKKDITVTSNGSLASVVKLYGTDAASTKALAKYVDITIVEGTLSGSTFTPLASNATVYSGTLDAFGSQHTDYADGVSVWQPTGTAGEKTTFEISYTLDQATPNTAQAGTAALGFTWEAQSK
jgi:hypothetical protein